MVIPDAREWKDSSPFPVLKKNPHSQHAHHTDAPHLPSYAHLYDSHNGIFREQYPGFQWHNTLVSHHSFVRLKIHIHLRV